jgi:hypothetical protein
LLTNKNKCSSTCQIYSYGFSRFKVYLKHKVLVNEYNNLKAETDLEGTTNMKKFLGKVLVRLGKKVTIYTNTEKNIIKRLKVLGSNLKLFYIEYIREKMLQYELVK